MSTLLLLASSGRKTTPLAKVPVTTRLLSDAVVNSKQIHFIIEPVLLMSLTGISGFIKNQDILEKTMEADVVFRFSDPKVPKTKYESPNKLFEAMMCGKPIIVSDGGSMANIVRAEDCGLVVPYGDIEAIRNAIIMLKEDQHLKESLGQNGRKAYESKYSWGIMEERLLNAYNKVRQSK